MPLACHWQLRRKGTKVQIMQVLPKSAEGPSFVDMHTNASVARVEAAPIEKHNDFEVVQCSIAETLEHGVRLCIQCFLDPSRVKRGVLCNLRPDGRRLASSACFKRSRRRLHWGPSPQDRVQKELGEQKQHHAKGLGQNTNPKKENE